MLGGGTFITKNKALPGTYINFVSAEKADSVLSERGVVAIPIVADWGPENTLIEISKENFKEDSMKLFGYESTHENMVQFREIFKNAVTILCYRLNSGTVKAQNSLAEAVYGGTRGNELKLVIQKNVDDESKYDVQTFFGAAVVDQQTVSVATELVKNDFVKFKVDAELEETAGLALQGGGDGSDELGQSYQKFLDKIQTCHFHVLGCPTKDSSIINLFVAYTKRMREEMGLKFQTVVYRSLDADYEGVISVENRVLNRSSEHELVYWVIGAVAGCAINQSLTNKKYDGEFTIDIDYTQRQLADAMKNGSFMLHKVGSEVRVLSDLNSLVSISEGKNEDMRSNQTIRVLDQIGTDIAAIFATKYLGIVPNNQSGRISLWDSILSYYKQLATMNAIEPVTAEEVVVEQGNHKKSVVVTTPVTPINCMEQLYMTVIVQ